MTASAKARRRQVLNKHRCVHSPFLKSTESIFDATTIFHKLLMSAIISIVRRSVQLQKSYLMSLQSIFTSERLSASTIAEERPFTGVRFLMTFEVMLAIERQCAHIARKRSLRRSRDLFHHIRWVTIIMSCSARWCRCSRTLNISRRVHVRNRGIICSRYRYRVRLRAHAVMRITVYGRELIICKRSSRTRMH